MLLSETWREAHWQLKNICKWSPKATLPRRGCSDVDLQAQYSPTQYVRIRELTRRYPLLQHGWMLGKSEFSENLYLLDLLDRYVNVTISACRGLEIGCRSFYYLPALYSFRAFNWDGVELDAYARFLNGRTRRAYGEAYAQAFSGCHYHADDVRTLQGSFDIIVWLLPFTTLAPLQLWGLPTRFFAPQQLLEKSYQLLSPAGKIFLVTQGEQETTNQCGLLQDSPIEFQDLGELDAVLSPFRQRRFGFLITRKE
jgi:hypothetical protein